MEFSTICRVCMQPISLEYIDLDTPFNEATYFECLNFCTKLEAKSSDKLPKTICLSCANLLQMTYDFINAATEADRLFREYFAKLEENDDDIFEDEIVSKEIIVHQTFSAQNETFVSETKPTKYEELIDVDDHQKTDLTHKNLAKWVESEQSIQDEELHEYAVQLTRNAETKGNVMYILPKEETKPINKALYCHAVNVDTRKDQKLIEQMEVDTATELPQFEIIESIEVEKQEDAVHLTGNTEAQYDILPKEETMPKIIEERTHCTQIVFIEDGIDVDLPKDDSIESELAEIEIEDKFANEKDQLEDIPSANQQSESLVQETKPKIRCHICNKKIRKNYADHMNQHTGNKPYKCDKCDDSFFTLHQFIRHKAEIHKKFRDAWFCNKCGEAFESGAKLKTHEDNDHNKTSGLCLTCGDSFSDQDALEQHVKDKHWSRRCPVECTHCKKKYQLSTLPMHVQYAHLDVVQASENKEFTCEYCFESYEGPAELENHFQTHKGKRYYTCATCGKDFKSKNGFEEHKATMHPVSYSKPNIGKCNKCDYTSNDLALLKKHKQKHYEYHSNRSPKYLCASCPRKFYSIKLLNDHEGHQHGGEKTAYPCNLCDKTFNSFYKLNYHKRSAHKNDRPFMCKECPKTFKLKSQLLQHEKIHYERKFNCPQCDKKFVQPCYLRVHLRTHTNELPFECHLCDKKFAIKVRLTYHLAKHEGIVRKCEYCPETFANMAKLRIHRFQHTGYPYVCDHCKENHHKKESFIRHMKRYHGIIMTEVDVEENRLKNMKNIYKNLKVKAELD